MGFLGLIFVGFGGFFGSSRRGEVRSSLAGAGIEEKVAVSNGFCVKCLNLGCEVLCINPK